MMGILDARLEAGGDVGVGLDDGVGDALLQRRPTALLGLRACAVGLEMLIEVGADLASAAST